MKLNQDTIDWLIERKERMRNPTDLYFYMWVHGWHKLKVVFNGFLKQLVFSWAFEMIGNHYKLKDEKILYNFKKKLW